MAFSLSSSQGPKGLQERMVHQLIRELRGTRGPEAILVRKAIMDWLLSGLKGL